MRLDKYLFENRYFDSRRKAQDAITDGLVKVNGKVILKCSFDFIDGEIIITEREIDYVSRGGYKLNQAINNFKLNLKDTLVLDIGASTGGFTDCCLRNGARHVFALDVGTLQLSPKLRNDPRVTSIENMNFKDAKSSDLNDNIFDFIVIDVSFISLEHIFANLKLFTDNETKIVALIKPQFELGDISIANKGIISKKEDHLLAIKLVEKRANKYGFYLEKLTFSPIVGEKKGNIEFIGLFSSKNLGNSECLEYTNIVNIAHDVLKGGR